MSHGVTSNSNGVEDLEAAAEEAVDDTADGVAAALEAVVTALECVSTGCLKRLSRLKIVVVVDPKLDE